MFANLKMRTKLMLLAAIPIAGLMLFAVQDFATNWQVASGAGRVRELVAAATKAGDLAHELQRERGLSAGFLASQGSKFAGDLPPQRQNTNSALAAFRPHVAALEGMPGQVEALANLGRLDELRAQVDKQSISAPDEIAFFTQTIGHLTTLVGRIAKLTDDSALAKSLVAYHSFMLAKENTGIERAVLNSTFAQDHYSPGMFERSVELRARQVAFLEEFQSLATPEEVAFYQQKMQNPFVDKVNELRAVSLRTKSVKGLEAEGFGVNPADWWTNITGVINLMKEVENLLAHDVDAGAVALHERAVQGLWRSGVTTGVFALFAVLVSALIARGMTRAMGTLSGIARRLGEGDLRVEIPTDVGEDEIGALYAAFRTMITGLRELMGTMQQGVAQLSSNSMEIAGTAKEFAAAAAGQGSTVAEVSTTSEELSQSSRAASDIAMRVVDAAEQAVAAGRRGIEVTNEAVSSIGLIGQRVQSIAQQILALSERTMQIGEIVQSVGELAEQSNLLAVNASIEAAKAGEQGRGFAVVASEVRKLAEQSKEATGQIRAILAEIQRATHSAVMASEEGTKRTEDGSRTIAAVRSVIQELAEALEESSERARQIGGAASQQATGIRQIAVSMEDVAEAGQRSSAGADQLQKSAAQLSMLATELQSFVVRYRV